jgi:hypothetical protein
VSSIEFVVTERPKRGLRGRWTAFNEALVKTSEGKALQIAGDDKSFNGAQNAARLYIGRYHQGLRVRTSRQNGHAFFWVEPR